MAGVSDERIAVSSLCRQTAAAICANLTALVTVALLSAACGGASSSTSPSPTTSFTPVPGSALYVLVNPTVLGVGETGRASSGLRFPDTEVTSQTSWLSLNPTIATVSPSGVVTAMSSGAALIQGQYRGSSATFPVQVISGADIVELIINKGTFMMGQQVGFAPRLVLTPGNVIYDLDPSTRATYASSNSRVATIAPDGMLTTIAPGTTDVTVTYVGKSATEHILIVPAGDDVITIVSSTMAGDVTVGGTVTLSMTVSCVLKSTSSGQATIRIFDNQFPSHLVGSFPSIDVSGDGPQRVTIQGSFTVPAGLPSICPMAVLTMSSGKAVAAYDVCRPVR